CAYRDADAHARRYFARVEPYRLAHHRLQALGKRDRLALVAQIANQDRKLVSPQARAHVGWTQLRAHALRPHDEQGVARAVTEAVVDRLEAVEIEKQHREAEVRIVLHRPHCSRELIEEVSAIR